MPVSALLIEKIGLLFKDIEKMSQADKIKTVERFVRAELKLQETPHVLDYQALFQMTSQAKQIARDVPTNLSFRGRPLHQDPEMFRMYCYFLAVYGYMRGNNLTPFEVRVKTDENP